LASGACNLNIPTLDSTLRYYNEHAEEFCANTFSLDMSELYRPFLERVPEGGRILDAGCGSGRDALAFSQLGYEVEAFDASAEIVQIAREQTGLDIKVDTFESFRFDEPFDGIWACASLLHLSETELVPCLIRMRDALAPGGVMYASFKLGDGMKNRGDRAFLDLTRDGIIDMVAQVSDLEVAQLWVTDDLRPGRVFQKWANALVCKPLIE
jgi:SAM-dependent methyltransferase